jgi:hypothetical protein
MIIGEGTVIRFKVVNGDLEAEVSHDGITWMSDGFNITLHTPDGLNVKASMPQQKNRRWKKGEKFRGLKVGRRSEHTHA